MTVWFGVFLPAGTPKDIVEKLNATMQKVPADPAVRTGFDHEGRVLAADTMTDLARVGREAGLRREDYFPA